MEKLGLNVPLNALCGFGGSIVNRYEGKWYRPFFTGWAKVTDFILVSNLVTIGLHFMSPGVELAERCASGFPLATLALVSLRSAYVKIQARRFNKLIEQYATPFPGDPFLQHWEEVCKKGAADVRPFSRILASFLVAPMTPYCFLPIVRYFTTGETILSVPAIFFFPYTHPVVFVLITLLQTGGATFVPMKNIAFEDIFYCLASRQLALMRHLEHNFERLLDTLEVSDEGEVTYRDYSGRETTKENVSVIMKDRIYQWVLHHRHVSGLMKELQSLYSPALLVQFGLQVLLLCTNAFVVVEAQMERIQIYFGILYVFGNVIQLLLACRLGDLLQIQSGRLTTGVTGKNVHVAPSQIFSSLNIILSRCQRKYGLAAFGIFPLNVDTFQSIIVSSYSYFTVLLKMKKTD